MNKKSNRPLSPHLQIYKLPMLAKLSISHRATGAALSIGAFALPIVLLSIATGGDLYNLVIEHITAWYGQVLLILVSVAIVYHLLNGIRHMLWDVGYGFELKSADRSGILVLVLTVIVTASIWLLAYL